MSMTMLTVAIGPFLVEFKYGFGDTVYLRHRMDKVPGLITGVHCRPNGGVYSVCWGHTGQESPHYELELTDEYEGRR
jgi:hypothetical protein